MMSTSSRILLFLLLWLVLCPCATPTVHAVQDADISKEQRQSSARRLANQWQNPTDVLTILMIIGGDIVQKAIAQLCGGYFVPVAFSFGWVSYSFNTLLAVLGDGALMPVTVYPSFLINARSGYARQNYSWILNRLLRDVEHSLDPLNAALCVSVFCSKPSKCRTSYDWLWWIGVITIFVQLTIAIVPYVIESDWTIFFITVIGIGLALSGGSLPQWRKEKWGARIENKNTTICLTRGSGFQHVVVILNQGPGCLNLEDLAMPQRHGCTGGCKTAITILAVLWIMFLISVAGLQKNAWYLLGVGFVGMAQNIFVAAMPRRPDAMGIPLDFVTRIQGPKVMTVLMNTEYQYPSAGAALVKTYFPGKLKEEEEEFWSRRANETRSSAQRRAVTVQPRGNFSPPPAGSHMTATSFSTPITLQSAVHSTAATSAETMPPVSPLPFSSTPP